MNPGPLFDKSDVREPVTHILARAYSGQLSSLHVHRNGEKGDLVNQMYQMKEMN